MSLTRYPQGSFQELLAISIPLMVSTLSAMAMLFVDRLMLAHYSKEAFNAAINASTLGWSLTVLTFTIAAIAEVFVAQYNGAKRFKQMGRPVWQMLYFGLFSFAFYVPCALFASSWIYPQGRELERAYFTYIIAYAPFFPMGAALTSFFVGQGKTGIISVISLLINLLNFVLDYVLIFGVDPWIPSLGIKGAAIATSFSQGIYALTLFVLFIKKSNRDTFDTHQNQFDPKLFFQCLKVGIPGGIAHMLEIMGWTIFYELMTYVSSNYILAAGIAQSFIILFFFFIDGLMKGATAVAGNLIGAKKIPLIRPLLKNGLILTLLFGLALFTFHPVILETIDHQFLDEVLPHNRAIVFDALEVGMFFIYIYLIFESIRFVYIGVLTAGGDTLFLLIAGCLSIWTCLVIPCYVALILFEVSLLSALTLPMLFSILSLFVYIIRYKQKRWIKMDLAQ